MTNKLRGLFLNTERAICSIYESGKMCYDCLVTSNIFSLDYVELSAEDREISVNYDFYIFNYHWVQMAWLDTKSIKKIAGFKTTIVLEMSQNNPFDCVSKDDFDAYLVLDPTCKHILKNVYAFPRPLETEFGPIHVYKADEVPIIGTFGLSFSDKGFDEVVKAVNREFDTAIVRINVPESSNNSSQAISEFQELLKGLNLKKDIKVELSHHYFTKRVLVNWCAENTLNVFLYNRRIGNGLSATTDQAIASGRPLAISTNPTFRHIHSYIKPYPYISLKESIENTISIVKKIQADWSSQAFVSKFEEVLRENNVQANENRLVIRQKLPANNYLKRVCRKLFTKKFVYLFMPPILFAARKKANVPSIQPFVHQALLSQSQFQEDLLIDLLLGRKSEGVYLDISAVDAVYHNHSARFYLRGWRGVNVQPNLAKYNRMAKDRKFDVNLNIAISNDIDKLKFYHIDKEEGCSTLDYAKAERMAFANQSVIASDLVDVLPIAKLMEGSFSKVQVDFMSVRAGTNELEILMTNDWSKYRPTIVLVSMGNCLMEMTRYMDTNNYLHIFNNTENAIFVDKFSREESVANSIFWN